MLHPVYQWSGLRKPCLLTRIVFKRNRVVLEHLVNLAHLLSAFRVDSLVLPGVLDAGQTESAPLADVAQSGRVQRRGDLRHSGGVDGPHGREEADGL